MGYRRREVARVQHWTAAPVEELRQTERQLISIASEFLDEGAINLCHSAAGE
jgi:hypothetical protein